MKIAARALVAGVLLVGLIWLYWSTALNHAQAINTVKARGDQSAYLYEAQILYRNWHRLNDPPVIQPRNRMPLYPGLLALLYDPQWTDWEFFDAAKAANVYLSLGLLAIIGVVLFRQLPVLPALNVLLILAFGVFIFKAAYTQSELLFYTLFFATFCTCWRLLVEAELRRRLALAGAAGVAAALAHLTKAAVLPFVALIVAVMIARALIAAVRTKAVLREGAVPLVFVATFLLIVGPYISTSKRLHGQYFYNLNSAVLVWYDNYGHGAAAIQSYGPDGWPRGPRSQRPGPAKYWKEHTLEQMASRLGRGLWNMVRVSYDGYWFLKFVVAYIIAAIIVVATRPRVALDLIRDQPALALFLMAYAAVYIPAIAFYEPISGTGTARFLLAHVGPLLFALTALLNSRAIRAVPLQIGRFSFTVGHLHLVVAVVLALDIVFVIPARVMTTYGGF